MSRNNFDLTRRRHALKVMSLPLSYAALHYAHAAVLSTAPAASAVIARAYDAIKACASSNTDATGALQYYVDLCTKAGTSANIPAGHYAINPDVGILLRSGTRLVLAPKAILAARPTHSKLYAIVRVYGVTNASLSGGQIIGDRAKHLGSGGEWGMGVHVCGSSDITISDVSASDCWGDGFNIGKRKGYTNPCRNITLQRVSSTSNRRQGLSVINCVGAKILNSTFSSTHGTAPAAGIDLEPMGSDPVEDILIEHCALQGNAGAGIEMWNHVDRVTIDSCSIHDNRQGGILVRGLSRNVTITRNAISSALAACIYVGKRAQHYSIKDNNLRPSPLARGLQYQD